MTQRWTGHAKLVDVLSGATFIGSAALWKVDTGQDVWGGTITTLSLSVGQGRSQKRYAIRLLGCDARATVIGSGATVISTSKSDVRRRIQIEGLGPPPF